MFHVKHLRRVGVDPVKFCEHYDLTEEQYKLLVSHLEWVIEANKRVRLTAIEDFDLGLRLHVGDSLEVLPEISAAPNGMVLDMGSGGGFPGVPIAIMSQRKVVCLDSVQKKMSALNGFVEANPSLASLLSTAAVRAEELAIARPGEFSCVVARALSSLPSLVELSAPLLSSGGWLVAMKGNIEDSEIAEGLVVAAVCGLEQVHIRRYTLFGGDESRAIVVYRKIGQPQIALPRRVGMAQRKPLA